MASMINRYISKQNYLRGVVNEMIIDNYLCYCQVLHMALCWCLNKNCVGCQHVLNASVSVRGLRTGTMPFNVLMIASKTNTISFDLSEPTYLLVSNVCAVSDT